MQDPDEYHAIFDTHIRVMNWRYILFLFFCMDALNIAAQQSVELDSTFAVNGKLILAEHGAVVEIVPAGNSIYVLAKNGTNASVVLKLHPDGQLDTTFAEQGKLLLPYAVKRLFVRADGQLITVGNTSNWNNGRVSCFNENGTIDLTYGIDGNADLTAIGGKIKDADILNDDRIVICSDNAPDSIPGSISSVWVAFVDNDGTVDPNTVIHLPAFTSWCPDGLVYRGYTCQIVREYGDEIMFYVVTRQHHTCGGNPHYYTGIRYIYTKEGDLVEENVWHPPITPGFHTTLALKMSSDLRYAIFKLVSWVSLITSAVVDSSHSTEVVSMGFVQFGSLFVPGVYGNADCPPNCNLNYVGKIAQDPAGRYIIPIRHGSTYWTFRSKPHSLEADSTWGYNGFLPAEAGVAVQGGGMAAAVQTDGKVLSGGYVTIGGQHRFALYRYKNTPSMEALVNATVILAGPYSQLGQLMKDNLRSEGYLPTTHTATISGQNAISNPIIQHMAPELLDVTGDSAVVDWIWLELIPAGSPGTVAASKAALVLRNGTVTGENGSSPVDMNCGPGDYHLRVRHRNHLAVMTSNTYTLGEAPVTIDLTSPATTVYGEDARIDLDGVLALWPGDVNANGQVKYIGSGNDRDPILVSIGGTVPTATITGYHREDVNMDGEVKYTGSNNDRDAILETLEGLPTGIRSEQYP
jgi:hypothetical protein